ncbi:cell division protein FtsB [Actinoplanes campanulatus]|uniref:Cell division protein FtsB n=1 Tax=Actinoplanes campanulatus TaxID=113559 RepID=A0A7W5FI67_9ACTN|nr:hypothetical protein [Actinoplanes campanulatus]MBB3099371.1 cell division protein FtsB [Actinoplanes campanulatus]GGN40250.1 hypothetical protein GCM10010109_69150 [Actinoplanes campanulatus]GID42420.1 hypothetical protein Aca09nite_89260 [Actinoplanes campanulatus]
MTTEMNLLMKQLDNTKAALCAVQGMAENAVHQENERGAAARVIVGAVARELGVELSTNPLGGDRWSPSNMRRALDGVIALKKSRDTISALHTAERAERLTLRNRIAELERKVRDLESELAEIEDQPVPPKAPIEREALLKIARLFGQRVDEKQPMTAGEAKGILSAVEKSKHQRNEYKKAVDRYEAGIGGLRDLLAPIDSGIDRITPAAAISRLREQLLSPRRYA